MAHEGADSRSIRRWVRIASFSLRNRWSHRQVNERFAQRRVTFDGRIGAYRPQRQDEATVSVGCAPYGLVSIVNGFAGKNRQPVGLSFPAQLGDFVAGGARPIGRRAVVGRSWGCGGARRPLGGTGERECGGGEPTGHEGDGQVDSQDSGRQHPVSIARRDGAE